jgi:hypothetical protein
MLKKDGKGNLVVLLPAERAQSRINQATLFRNAG